MASITTWTRIEPVARDPDMADGLKAAIRDPLWLLARQWQFGEFQGTDGGSPALARFQAGCGKLDRFLPDYDPDRTPTTFSKFGLTDFDFEYWNGSGWSLVPDGEIRNNDKVHVRATFPPVRTDRIRIVVKGAREQFSRIVELEALQADPQPSDRDIVWVGDATPAGAAVRGDGWEWAADPAAPAGGARTHWTPSNAGLKQHYFEGCSEPLPIHEAETLFAYVRLDPANPPKQIMLQWFDGTWDHRAYWGESRIDWGVEGRANRRRLGDLPIPGVWTRLEVPASLVALEGRAVRGMAFTQFGGIAIWGAAGKTRLLPPGSGLCAEYFPSVDLTGSAVTRIDPVVDFAWGTAAPHPAIPADKFSARWTGEIAPLFSETYSFHVTGDDGVRLWIDDQLIVNGWLDQAATEYNAAIALQAGRRYRLRLDYYDGGGPAACKLMWSSRRQPKQVIPQAQLYPPASYAAAATNVALAANGGRASASSTHSAAFPVVGVNNGDRTGAGWGQASGGWNDATAGDFPDWLQVSFNGEKLISEIGIVTLQDGAPIEPIPSHVGAVQPLNGGVPLEALVEREQAQAEDDLREATESGLHFLRILAAQGLQGYGPVITRAHAFEAGVDVADAASRRFAGVMFRRAPDGRKLSAALKAAAPGLPESWAIAAKDWESVRAAADAWLAWRRGVAPTAPASAPTWRPERMEYAFAVSAATPAGRVDLAARDYPGGALDWHAFDAHLQPGAGGGETVVIEAIPAPVSYRGMPAPRYWQFEDAEVNWGDVKAGETDLARLTLLEFALVGSDDWFVIPVELEAGSVCAAQSLEIDDTFGIRTAIRHHEAVDGPRSGWGLFGLTSPRQPSPEAPPLLFLAPTLLSPLESAPIEEVLFLRDEMANMAWAVERVVQSPTGRPLDRYEAYRAAKAGVAPAERADAGANLALAYKVGSEPPDYWIPMVTVQSGPRATRLRRSALASADGVPIAPLGRTLEPGRRLDIYEEEIPRAGARVTRSWQLARGVDGHPCLWMGRRKQPGRGEGSSGLVFDTARKPQPQV
ncbi:PA14 domain-containing protein [Allosphingosinicella deserti]|uniref:PA14 domain-containing protein n=1 Tax=Allosphingosinicella deserti TaxID=2116704 RepID=A0A2P7QIB1_9SPHN|nr:PA14 domain-containing protein [Sphingomonas deserti]PSJ37666.1 hypothetical protein C7I55_21630 [Sphingomonas deserti]